MALTSDRVTLTENPLATALSRVTVKVIPAPSAALIEFTVTWALSLSVIVPVPVSVSVTEGSEALSETMNVSSPSKMASSSVATANCSVSPAVPAKLSAATTLS